MVIQRVQNKLEIWYIKLIFLKKNLRNLFFKKNIIQNILLIQYMKKNRKTNLKNIFLQTHQVVNSNVMPLDVGLRPHVLSEGSI